MPTNQEHDVSTERPLTRDRNAQPGISLERSGPAHALALMIGVFLFYGAISALFILNQVPHRVLALLALQCLVVLPATVYYLRTSHGLGEWKGVPDWCAIAAAVLAISAAAAVGIHIYPGVTICDESAYQFQARILASGHLSAEPLPGAGAGDSAPIPISFEQHVIRNGMWFAKYPLGWPAILAIGARLHLIPLVNPLLGACLALLTFGIARDLFGRRVAFVSVLLVVLSPFFLANIAGTMAHASCAVLVTLAGYFCLRGIRYLKIRFFVLAFALLAAAAQIRPVSGLAAGLAMGGAALYCTRCRPRVLLGVLAAGIAAAVVAGSCILAVNHYFSGNAFVSPYALSGLGAGEFALRPSDLLRNLLSVTRRGLAQTVLFTVPFCFVMVVYALFRESTDQRAALITASLPFLVTVILYNMESNTSASANGDRYYFEPFCLVCIVAARGFVLLVDRWRPSPVAVSTLLGILAGLQLIQQAVTLPALIERSYVSRQVRKHLTGASRIVFLTGTGNASPFVAKHANWNDPDWRHAHHVYLVDPGASQRAEWANRFEERSWRVVGYDATAKAVSVEEGGVRLRAEGRDLTESPELATYFRPSYPGLTPRASAFSLSPLR